MNILLKLLSYVNKLLQYSERKASLRSAIDSGMVVGEFTKFVGTQNFGSEPYLIQFGENCLITDQVGFNTHDGGIQVPMIKSGMKFSETYGQYSNFGRITVGDNVFIGTGTIILLKTRIGNNVLIAAGSVVKGIIPSDVVAGGVPATIICSIDEYFEKHKEELCVLKNSNLNSDNRKKLIIEHLDRSVK